MNFSLITLGELLSHKNEIVKRNALSILKQLQKERDKHPKCPQCGEYIWDKAAGSKLNKCWSCNLAFD